jgi:hypothetical protein
MTSNSQAFLRNLGAAVATQLGPEFVYSTSKLELKRKVLEGHDVIVLSGSAKYSPYINVAFYYGKSFAAARTLEKAARVYAFPYHIQQFSLNWRPSQGGAYQGKGSWSIDLNSPPPDLAQEIAAAIQGIAFPFFVRFSSLTVARDALAANDPGCFGGPTFWSQLLRLDATLSDLPHFQRWSECLDEWTRGQAEVEMTKFGGVTAGGA